MSQLLDAFKDWYFSLKLYAGAFPAKGTISGGLIVLERLKLNIDLSIDAHTAEGGSQIIGTSGQAVKRHLLDHGESRAFVSEGGRTNRGLRGDIKALLDALSANGFSDLSQKERLDLLRSMQTFLVSQVKEWHNRQRIELQYDDRKTTRDLVSQILERARERGQVGPVAQYLVGAKLQLRFPDLRIENDSYSTSDAQLGRHGDFVVGDTVFHITVSPLDKVYERCQKNLEDGMRAYLIVPLEILQAARTNADSIAPNRISVEAIESFVGGNVDELSRFSKNDLVVQLGELIRIYNQRVDQIEVDKSMMIETPHIILPRYRNSP